MTTNDHEIPESTVKGIRRIAIWTIITSLVLAAGIGIATIVGGDFGETESRVLLTAFAVAAFAILMLCHLTIINRNVRVLGWVGIGTSAVALVAAIILIWWSWGDWAYSGPGTFWDVLNKSFVISTLLAVSIAHANLMLLLSSTPIRWVRIALDLNLILIAVIPLLLVPVILTDGTFPPASLSDVYWRFFGVVLILDALGTVSLPITSLIIRSQRKASGLDSERPDEIAVTIRGVAATWLAETAAAQESTPLAVIEDLIERAGKKKK